MRGRPYDQHFKLRPLAQAPGDRLGDAHPTEKLIFDIDGTFGDGDGVEEQRLDLAHFRLPLEIRLGAGNADIDVDELGFDLAGPGIVRGLDRRQRLVRGIFPARTREIGERARGRAVEQHLHVMKRLIGPAGVIAA